MILFLRPNSRKEMKKLLFSAALVAMIGLVSCGEQKATTEEGAADVTATEGGETAITPDNVEALTSIVFEEESFDFGTITQGEKVEHTFKFTNTGSNDLVIVSAKGSCGCTIPKWPKEPIKPGQTGDMYVIFNSDGKSGKQHKKVSVIANTEPATSEVALQGDVIAPGSDATTTPATNP